MQSGDAGAIDRVLRSRHSCRGFLADPVPRATLERILDTAQCCASGCNSQAWQLIITEGRGTERFRSALSEYARTAVSSWEDLASTADIPMPERYVGVYKTRRRECAVGLYAAMGIELSDRDAVSAATLRNFIFFGAPHVAIVTTPKTLGTYGAVDCGGFVSLFMNVAWAHGVASVAQGSFALVSGFVRQYFDLPEDRLVLCGISFGYEDPANASNQFRATRAALDETVQWVSD